MSFQFDLDKIMRALFRHRRMAPCFPLPFESQHARCADLIKNPTRLAKKSQTIFTQNPQQFPRL